MKIIISTLVVLILVIPAFCQQDSLLKSFKFRNSNYRIVNFNLGGGSFYDRSQPVSGAIKNSAASASGSVNYYTVKSTDKILLTTSAGFGTNYYTDKTTSTSENNKTKSFSISDNVSFLNKWFTKNNFTELGTDIASNFSRDKNNISTFPAVTKIEQNYYSFALNTGIGTGRLENITDMQNALWLSKALSVSGSLSHPLSATELNELGRTITKVNNTRILDSRKRTQFILAILDNYFQQGRINKSDITYFSNLNDILFFAFNTPRLSGTEKFIRFTPAISGNSTTSIQNNNVDDYKDRSTSQSIVLSTGFNKYVANSLVHQNNYGAAIKFTYKQMNFSQKYFTAGNLISVTESNPLIKQASVSAFFEHAIYPNTRTLIDINLQTEGGYQNENKLTGMFFVANLTGSLNYFISYRTRLNCSIGAAYRNNLYQASQYLELLPNNIQLYANAGINISI